LYRRTARPFTLVTASASPDSPLSHLFPPRSARRPIARPDILNPNASRFPHPCSLAVPPREWEKNL